jgi:hypothetical protein
MGGEALGVAGGFMVYDPSTPDRRVFVEYRKKVCVIVSEDRLPVTILAKAVRQK